MRAPDFPRYGSTIPSVFHSFCLHFRLLNFKSRECVSWNEGSRFPKPLGSGCSSPGPVREEKDVLQLLWQGYSRRRKPLRLLRQAGGGRGSPRAAGAPAILRRSEETT